MKEIKSDRISILAGQQLTILKGDEFNGNKVDKIFYSSMSPTNNNINRVELYTKDAQLITTIENVGVMFYE